MTEDTDLNKIATEDLQRYYDIVSTIMIKEIVPVAPIIDQEKKTLRLIKAELDSRKVATLNGSDKKSP